MNWLEKTLLHGGTILAGLSGLAYAAFKYLMVNEDPFSAVNHPMQPWALAVHVMTAPLLVFAAGWIFKDHVVGKMKNGSPPSAKRIGVLIMAALVPLILSGYLIQVISAEMPRRWTAWIHLGLGAFFLALYAIHRIGVAGKLTARSAARKRLAQEEMAGSGLQIIRREGLLRNRR
jgi:hypothetical protein